MLASSEMPPRPGPAATPARASSASRFFSSFRPLPESWISMPTPFGTSLPETITGSVGGE
ncbi:hypothetical protein SGLAM104S_06288 [Streptomyces glaucescens]